MVVTTQNILTLAAADGVLACTGLHNITRTGGRGGREGGGYHIMAVMAVRHDNVAPGDTGCHNIIFSVLRILMIEPRYLRIMSVNICVNISNNYHHLPPVPQTYLSSKTQS